MAAGGEADAGHLVVEAEAVLAPPVGSDPEGQITDLARGRPLGLARPGPAVLEAGQEALGQFGPAREVEGVDAGRQLPQPRLGRCVFATSWSDGVHGSHLDAGSAEPSTAGGLDAGGRSARTRPCRGRADPGEDELVGVRAVAWPGSGGPCGRWWPGASRPARGCRSRRPDARPPRSRSARSARRASSAMASRDLRSKSSMLRAGVEKASARTSSSRLWWYPAQRFTAYPATFGALALVAAEIKVFGHGREYVAWLRQALPERGKSAGRPPIGRPWPLWPRIRPGPSRLPLRAAAPALTGPVPTGCSRLAQLGRVPKDHDRGVRRHRRGC